LLICFFIDMVFCIYTYIYEIPFCTVVHYN
jgi:hypothetical protein